MKKSKTIKKYQLWDLDAQYGLDFDSEIACVDHAMGECDYVKKYHFLILQGSKLIKSFSVDRGKVEWINH